MNTITLHNISASEFVRVNNPLANSIFAHYAHTAMSTASLASIYNYMILSNVSPMDSVERHVDVLVRAEHAYNF